MFIKAPRMIKPITASQGQGEKPIMSRNKRLIPCPRVMVRILPPRRPTSLGPMMQPTPVASEPMLKRRPRDESLSWKCSEKKTLRYGTSVAAPRPIIRFGEASFNVSGRERVFQTDGFATSGSHLFFHRGRFWLPDEKDWHQDEKTRTHTKQQHGLVGGEGGTVPKPARVCTRQVARQKIAEGAGQREHAETQAEENITGFIIGSPHHERRLAEEVQLTDRA